MEVLDGRVLLTCHDHHLQVLLLCDHLTLQLETTGYQHLREYMRLDNFGGEDGQNLCVRSGPDPGLWVLAPLLPLSCPQNLVKLPGLSLPVQELSQTTVQTRHAVLQLCTNLLCLKQGLQDLVRG